MVVVGRWERVSYIFSSYTWGGGGGSKRLGGSECFLQTIRKCTGPHPVLNDRDLNFNDLGHLVPKFFFFFSFNYIWAWRPSW